MIAAVRWLSGIAALLVLIQAVLIGQALYVNGMTTVALHGWLGSVSAQLGLGHSGRQGGLAAALHIPNGVLIAGLLFALFAAANRPLPGPGRGRA